jgi:hypothetical protein
MTFILSLTYLTAQSNLAQTLRGLDNRIIGYNDFFSWVVCGFFRAPALPSQRQRA